MLHRVPVDEHVDWFLNSARYRGKVVLFDTDDLVFQTKAAGDTLDLISLPEVERQIIADRLERHSTTMTMCDGVLVTTEPLAELARELNPNVQVVPNVASKEMVEIADTVLAEKAKAVEPGKLTIAYLSGTPTHDRDFLQAAAAVLWALQQYPAARFLVVGNLTLDPRFERFGDRITRMPIQPWRRLPRLLAGVDISLAPLESDNPFTESKSCLKYIEAGLVGVPTIASPRADFVRAIEPGRNGLLSETPGEWQEALGRLLESSELRAQLGQAASEDVRARHTTLTQAPRLYDTIAGLMGKPGSRTLTVHWLADPDTLSQTQAASLVPLVRHLRRARHTVRVFANGGTALPEAEELAVEALPERSGEAVADVSIALDSESAAMLAKRSDSLFKLLLVDAADGNGLRGASDRELRSLLELPLRPVCLGEQLASRLSSLRGMDVDWLPLPLEPARFEELLLEECFARAASLSR